MATATACGNSAERATGKEPVVASGRAPSETLSSLFQTALPNVEGKTFTSAIVDFPPGARAAPHRHGAAFVYAYVLEGTVASRLEGEPTRTYHQGENWVEQPGAHHVLTANTNRTKPAKLLVVFISRTGEAQSRRSGKIGAFQGHSLPMCSASEGDSGGRGRGRAAAIFQRRRPHRSVGTPERVCERYPRARRSPRSAPASRRSFAGYSRSLN
ncbi:cupin domain-containing protein [Candidatus Solirubrobacter pratensis]|uniref:cupin domain-containing protein n=1 Tax=Candidatus Solirubrobacter pratensis TaxID=1298857 RepID=UPI0018C9A7AB